MNPRLAMYPPTVPENAQKPETLIYGPKGEALLVRQPRAVGFKPPEQWLHPRLGVAQLREKNGL